MCLEQHFEFRKSLVYVKHFDSSAKCGGLAFGIISNPQRIFDEYQQRLQESKQTPLDHTYASIDKQRIKLEKIIELLIDSYTHQYIMKNEFEPRIKSIRQKLDVVREQQQKLVKQENLTKELELIVSNLEEFSSRIISRIDNLDWNGKREIIRGVVKRIEMEGNKIDIVYRVNQLPDNRNINTQHCSSRTYGSSRSGSQ